MHLDITLDPKPELQSATVSPPRALRVYASSYPGLVSVYLPGDAHGGGVGLRLDREQLETLHGALAAHLDATREA